MQRGIKKRLTVLRTTMAMAAGSGSAQKPVVLNDRDVDYYYCDPCEGPVCSSGARNERGAEVGSSSALWNTRSVPAVWVVRGSVWRQT